MLLKLVTSGPINNKLALIQNIDLSIVRILKSFKTYIFLT